MKVENMTSAQGHKVANQFIIIDKNVCGLTKEYFQSYENIIVKREYRNVPHRGLVCFVELDRNKWDYSKTTGKYRNLFLSETKKETQAKIDSGEYVLTDLN